MIRITALLTSLFFLIGCGSVPKVPWQQTAKTEMLKACWDNDRALISEACTDPEYIEWEHTPVSVSSGTDLMFMVMQSVVAWNEIVGFELFSYKLLDRHADVVFVRGGPHARIRGMTIFFKKRGKMRSGIFMYDSALTSMDTFLHELGHAIGLRHDAKDTRSIMYPTNGRYFPKVQVRDRNMLIDRYSPRKKD